MVLATPALGSGTYGVSGDRPPTTQAAEHTAFHRTLGRLQRLRQTLDRAAQQRGVTLPTFSLLLVEPALWSRFSADASGVTVAIDTEAPPTGSPVVVTGAAVIAAIAAGRVSPKDAFRRGLIVVDAPAETRADVKALLVAALSDLNERL
jgi:hypothetical protein